MIDKQTVKFGDICKEVKLTTKDPLSDGYERYIGLEHLDSGSLKIKRWGMIAEDKPSFTRVFKKGQILFGKRRPYLKKAAVAEFDGICSGDIIVMEPKGRVYDKRLLPFVVQSEAFGKWAVQTSSGSLSPRTKFKSLSEFEIVLHDKNFLEEKLSSLEKIELTIEIVEKARTASEVFLSSLRKELFSGEWINETRKSCECGVIPGSWSEERFDKVGSFVSGGTPKKSNSSYWNGDIPWFSPKDMKTVDLNSSIDFITKDGAINGSKVISENTLLFVVRGMILAHTFPVGITSRVSAFNQDMKAIVVSDEFAPRFVLNWMLANSATFLSMVSTSTHGTKRLSTDVFSTLWVPKPPIGVQEKIVEALEQARMIMSSLDSREKKLVSIRQALANNLVE